jgi:DNA-binding IclR family transcriptional regulator
MNDTGTVSRILKLISLLTDHPDISAKQAALRLGWPISTTHRLLRMLAAAEYATQQESGRFAPGLELFRIAGRLGVEMPYAQIAEPLLAALTAQFNETSLLTILERKQLNMYVALSAAPQDPMRYNIERNRRGSLAWGASGRALMAHILPEEVDRVIATCQETNARGEAVDPLELRASLQETREKGYAVTISHRVLHAVGIAVPFFDVQGQVVGSVAFQVPQFRYNPDLLVDMANALRQTAAVISQQLGSPLEP